MKPRTISFFLASASITACALAVQNRAAPPTLPATAPATMPAEGTLSATITAVQGLVQVREAEDQKWQAATVGMTVGQGAEFRTGPRSAVQFTIPPDQTVTLDRLGTVKLIDAIKTNTSVKTDLGMKYGRVRYDIEAAGLQHDSVIHSPGSTLAVRGTRVSLFNQGFYPVRAVSFTGRARFKTPNGHTSTLGGPGSSKTEMVQGTTSPGETALNSSFVDPTSSFSHTSTERQVIASNPVVAGFASGTISGQSSAIGAEKVTQPVTPTTGIGSGSLLFQLVWVPTSSGLGTPDLDLVVRSPLGELLSPKGGVSIVPSGGRAPVDDRGGKSTVGQETAIWPGTFPLGRYQLQVRHIDGPAAEFELFAVRNGQVITKPTVESISAQNTPINVNVNVGGNSKANPKLSASSKRR